MEKEGEETKGKRERDKSMKINSSETDSSLMSRPEDNLL